ncbi:hypothetical protein K3495_g7803 [Podosphaera aphanis]|nr:hypothetical protein K3495_g7803 [Podosphaera aphanis]
MSGDLLKLRGGYFLKELYPDAGPFEFSNGWLDRFKARYSIKSFRRFGESGSVDMVLIEEALPGLRAVLNKYEWKDIYNMDETGLFYRMQADNSLAYWQLEGRKESKERITAIICCNGDGTDKIPLRVIGKSKKPPCFKNLNQDNLGCRYFANAKAWMTQITFLRWIKWFDNTMDDRKFLLIMDNCSYHIPVQELPVLRNTTVKYLPPNPTSKIQPCDAGIIRPFKAYYRRRFNQKLLDALDDGIERAEKISILEGIQLAVAAWQVDVKQQTIANCYLHCKIRASEFEVAEVGDDEIGDQELLRELEDQVRRLHDENPMDIRNLLNYPAEQAVAYTLTEEEIVQELREPADLADEEDDDSMELPKITAKEAIKMMEKLKLFWLHQSHNQEGNLALLRKLKDAAANIHIKGKVQTTLDMYFRT